MCHRAINPQMGDAAHRCVEKAVCALVLLVMHAYTEQYYTRKRALWLVVVVRLGLVSCLYYETTTNFVFSSTRVKSNGISEVENFFEKHTKLVFIHCTVFISPQWTKT